MRGLSAVKRTTILAVVLVLCSIDSAAALSDDMDCSNFVSTNPEATYSVMAGNVHKSQEDVNAEARALDIDELSVLDGTAADSLDTYARLTADGDAILELFDTEGKEDEEGEDSDSGTAVIGADGEVSSRRASASRDSSSRDSSSDDSSSSDDPSPFHDRGDTHPSRPQCRGGHPCHTRPYPRRGHRVGGRGRRGGRGGGSSSDDGEAEEAMEALPPFSTTAAYQGYVDKVAIVFRDESEGETMSQLVSTMWSDTEQVDTSSLSEDQRAFLCMAQSYDLHPGDTFPFEGHYSSGGVVNWSRATDQAAPLTTGSDRYIQSIEPTVPTGDDGDKLLATRDEAGNYHYFVVYGDGDCSSSSCTELEVLYFFSAEAGKVGYVGKWVDEVLPDDAATTTAAPTATPTPTPTTTPTSTDSVVHVRPQSQPHLKGSNTGSSSQKAQTAEEEGRGGYTRGGAEGGRRTEEEGQETTHVSTTSSSWSMADEEPCWLEGFQKLHETRAGGQTSTTLLSETFATDAEEDMEKAFAAAFANGAGGSSVGDTSKPSGGSGSGSGGSESSSSSEGMSQAQTMMVLVGGLGACVALLATGGAVAYKKRKKSANPTIVEAPRTPYSERGGGGELSVKGKQVAFFGEEHADPDEIQAAPARDEHDDFDGTETMKSVDLATPKGRGGGWGEGGGGEGEGGGGGGGKRVGAWSPRALSSPKSLSSGDSFDDADPYAS